MSAQHNGENHGDSIAAWTSVTIIMIAFAIGTAGAWFEVSGLFTVAIILAVVGIVAGPVLSKLGFGIQGKKN
jgi:multisubunit Na+/H+ antiporter MnhF subunit